MSIYIHIPFCKTICSYCDFCKIIYDNKLTLKYLDSLKEEIEKTYKGEPIKTIYIGGGTPSCLNLEELRYLLSFIKMFSISDDTEFTFECNLDSLTEEKIKILKDAKVNRISIGIESFNKDNLIFLNRNCSYKEAKEKIDLLKKYGITNINVDLIYAIPGETIKTLKKDLSILNKLDITHISTYSLIIEDNTLIKVQGVKNIDEETDFSMYEYICKYLKNKGFNHYEISNFSKKGYESKHNLTYWNNEEYYGFGLGASGYINNIRYTNTRSFVKYLRGEYRLEETKLTIEEKKENELILGLRKISGVSKKAYFDKYQEKLEEKEVIKKLLERGLLKQSIEYIYISPKYIYTSNDILVEIIGEV